MQVRNIDSVGVGNSDSANAGSGEIHGRGRTQTSGPHDEDCGTLQRVLSFDTEIRQANLPCIPRKLVAGERLTDSVSRVEVLRVGTERRGHRAHALGLKIYNTRPSERPTGVLRARYTMLLERQLLTRYSTRERELVINGHNVQSLGKLCRTCNNN